MRFKLNDEEHYRQIDVLKAKRCPICGSIISFHSIKVPDGKPEVELSEECTGNSHRWWFSQGTYTLEIETTIG